MIAGSPARASLASALASAVALVALVAPAATHAQRPTVLEVFTATGDVHDVAAFGDDLALATSGGLVLVAPDGSTRAITSAQGLPGARARSVTVTSDGIWVGGIEGTALVRRAEDGALRVARRLDVRRLRRVVEHGGRRWFVGYDGIVHEPLDASEPPRPLAIGRSHARTRLTDAVVVGDELWVATAGAGVLRIGAGSRVVGRILARDGLADENVFDLEVDGARVLAATMAGVSVLTRPGGAPRASALAGSDALPVRDVRSVAVAGDSVYVAAFGAGAFRIRAGAAQPIAGEDGAQVPECGTAVRAGARVVFGHARGAFAVPVAGGRARAILAETLPSGDVTAIERAFGRIWVGTFMHGLAELRDGRVRADRRATARWGVDRRINDLAVTRTGGRELLWIATDRGLFVHDGRSFEPAAGPNAPYREHVTSLHVAADGALWVTSSRALARYRNGAFDAWTGDASFPVMHLHAVTTAADGSVWVGSLHGLYRFDPATGRFERHSVASGALPVDWVTALVRVGDEVVAGTYHGGLSFVGDGGFRIVPEGPGGIPAGWVNPHALAHAHGRLWVGTLERGLVVGAPGSWTRVRASDGLPSDDVTDVLPNDDGSVWVATRGGLARLR